MTDNLQKIFYYPFNKDKQRENNLFYHKKRFFCKFAAINLINNSNMKNLLLVILALLPFFAIAKDNKKKDNSNPKYLEGAITLKDGKVSFEEEIKVPTMSKEELYNTMLQWAEKRFVPNEKLKSSVVYKDEEKGEIVATAEEYLVFSSTALSLDRTRIYYHFYITAENGKCNLEMSRIRYWYDENRDGGERYTAEEWITDDMALNRKKTKLAPICGKFRRETIDLKDELFNSVRENLGQKMINSSNESTITNNTAKKTGKVAVSELPADLSKIAENGKLTIKTGDKENELNLASWGGFGKLFNKDVAYILIDKKESEIAKNMENSSSYTVSFYKDKSAKAAVIIECKKTMTQELTAEELKSLNQDIDTSKEYIMYICEVTSVKLQ